MARTMLKDSNLPNVYWKKFVHNIVYLLNRFLIKVNHTKTPYEFCNGRPPTIKYFKIFESK